MRRFGPTNDAGTAIIEADAERTITPAQLGSVAYIGILERGPVGEVIECVGKKDMLAKTGGLIPDSLLPDCNQDFWDESEGAGIQFLYRVTDGTEQQAWLELWNRASSKDKVVKVEAHNGGGWAGRRQTWVVDIAAAGDVTGETTIELPIAFHPIYEDQFKGGVLYSSETATAYQIVGNDESDGVAKTELRLAADSTLETDYTGGSDDLEFFITVDNIDVWGRNRNLAIEVGDGEENPGTEWALYVWLNGEMVKSFPNLSSDPNNSRYFVNVINDDLQQYIKVTDLWSGAVTAATRPANFHASVADTEFAAKQLDLATVLVVVDDSLAGANTIGSFTYGTDVIRDTYTIEYTAAWAVTSVQQATHSFGVPVTATPFPPDNKYSIGFTVTESTPQSGEKFVVHVIPLVADELIGGRLFLPGESWAPTQGWSISDNDEETVDILSGDLTNGGTISGSIEVRLQYPQKMEFGYDGIAQVADTDFVAAFDIGASPFNDIVEGQGYGLIKFACPGVTELLTSSLTAISNAQVVERAGVAYANAKNHQYRLEVPKTGTDEIVVRNYVHNVIGKDNYEKVCMHGYCKVSDPVLADRLKTIPTTGMIHGQEARQAADYGGYHKGEAGTETKLTRIRDLLTVTGTGANARLKRLNGEILNPAGIQRIEKKGGHFVIWGVRLPASDPAWKWSHNREQMSYYEHVLMENFDWITFAINDPIEQPGLLAALQSFFFPEWNNRALRGDTFEDACTLKIDDENNTDATRGTGDMNADISLQLADTIERFNITMNKKGAFESVTSS